jgi:hypothetical protein
MLKIERGIPAPILTTKRENLREAIEKLQDGESFLYHHAKSPLATASILHMKVIVRPEGEKYRVWKKQA